MYENSVIAGVLQVLTVSWVVAIAGIRSRFNKLFDVMLETFNDRLLSTNSKTQYALSFTKME
jgi:hypothetical protein